MTKGCGFVVQSEHHNVPDNEHTHTHVMAMSKAIEAIAAAITATAKAMDTVASKSQKADFIVSNCHSEMTYHEKPESEET